LKIPIFEKLKKFLLILSIIYFAQNSFAQNKNVIVSSIYNDGYFYTTAETTVNASDTVLSKMMDDFIYQLGYDLPALFTWALKDLKLKGETGELIIYNLKSTNYIIEEKRYTGIMDVKVPLIKTIENFRIWTTAEKSIDNEGHIQLKFSVVEADAFLKDAQSTLTIYRENENTARCILKCRMTFGWFFNIFITKKRYRDTAEWRFKQLLINIKEAAEK
jgi:hypothetical protein